MPGFWSRLAGWLARAYPPRERADARAFIDDALSDSAGTRTGGARFKTVAWLFKDLLTTRLHPNHTVLRAPRPTIEITRTDLRRLFMSSLLFDIRLGLRLLRRAPLFTAIAVITLALGIGATTAVFTVVDGAILRPFPYKDMPRIMLLSERTNTGMPMSVSYPNFIDWRAGNEVFEELGVYRGAVLTLSTPAGAERVNAGVMTSSVFDTIGIEPREGRRFGPKDDEPGEKTAVISERFWRSHYGEQPVIGQKIMLNSEPHTIIGIMPPSMRFPGRTTDVWLPFGSIVSTLPAARGAHPGLTGIGRLRAGVTVDQARTSMATIAKRLSDAYPNSNHNSTIEIDPYYEAIVRNIRPVLFVFLSAVGVVLLIACANLASLMLARGEGRQQEMAVRAALGAGRSRLIRQMLTEALVLASLGGAAGVALAYWLVRAFIASRPTTVPRIDLIGIDWRVLLFAAGAALLTAVLIGVLPALRGSRPDLQPSLKEGRRAVGGGTRLRGALVVAEIALALMLLVSAGLLIKSFSKLMAIDLGYNPERVVAMRVAVPDARYPTLEAWMAFHRTLLDRFSGAAGIEAIGIDTSLPLAGGVGESSMRKEGDPPPAPGQPSRMASFHIIGGDYFRAIGSRLVAGRAFDARDRDGGQLVAIIDDRGAARLFPGENPIGKRVAFESRGEPPAAIEPIWREIVGVVPHITTYSITDEPDHTQLFVPFEQPPTYSRARRPGMAIVARVTGDPAGAVASVRQMVTGVDAAIPVYGVQTLSELIGQANETPRLGMALIGSMSLLALVLALVGVYGVFSYAVSQRTREIGVRVALGAGRGQIVGLITRQAGLLVLIGLAIGTAGAFGATRFLTAFLTGVSPTDPAVFAIVGAALALAAVAASLIPARKAASVDPVVALRAD